MAEETSNGNIIVDNKKELEVIAALELLENYCLDKRDKRECESCVMAILMGAGDCPYRDEEICAPGDWEIREILYNSGRRIYQKQDWNELRRKVGKA